MTSLDPSKGVALWRQIASQLRERIQSAQLKPGEKMPSETELVEQYGVARTTVRLALKQLAADGLVYATQGRGTFVADRPVLRYRASTSHSRSRREATSTDVHQADLAEQGRRGHHTIHVEVIRAPDDVAARLELEDGTDQVLVRRRVHFVDDQPSHIGDTYYPAALVADSDIATPGQLDRGGNRVLAELGHEVVRRHDEIRTRMPTPQEAQALMIAGGVPVLFTLRTGYDKADRPVALYWGVWPGDRHVLDYDVDTTS
jgi:GntR family transcriptional regulator